MTTVTGEVRDANGNLVADATVRLYRRDTGALLASGLTGDGSEAQEGEPNYSSTSLQLHFDGANDSTTFTDDGPLGLAVSRSGDAKISTTQSKFGGASGYFDGTGDYLTVTHNAGLDFGTGDFTIECWVRLTTASAYRFLLGAASNNYMMIAFNYVANEINVGVGNVGWKLNFGSHGLQDNTWAHLLISRSGTSNRCFINGTQIGTTVTDSTSWAFPSGGMCIGYQTGGSTYLGYFDELRIVKGVATKTADFTAPSAAYLDQGDIAARPLGIYSVDTTYSGEIQRIVLDPDGDPLQNDLIDRITLS